MCHRSMVAMATRYRMHTHRHTRRRGVWAENEQHRNETNFISSSRPRPTAIECGMVLSKLRVKGKSNEKKRKHWCRRYQKDGSAGWKELVMAKRREQQNRVQNSSKMKCTSSKGRRLSSVRKRQKHGYAYDEFRKNVIPQPVTRNECCLSSTQAQCIVDRDKWRTGPPCQGTVVHFVYVCAMWSIDGGCSCRLDMSKLFWYLLVPFGLYCCTAVSCVCSNANITAATSILQFTTSGIILSLDIWIM